MNMSYAFSAGLEGLSAKFVRVEVNLKRGIPKFQIVGLAQASTRESTERVKIAIENAGFEFPMQSITVNLAPADSRKTETWYDLPIAILILVLSKQLEINIDFEKFLFLGELGLDGSVKPMKGLINILVKAKEEEFENILVPNSNRFEASLLSGYNVFPISHLSELAEILSPNKKPEKKFHLQNIEIPSLGKINLFNDQISSLRALSIAVTGRHHSLLIGNPGVGKTMLIKLAKNFHIPLTEEEKISLVRIKSSQNYLLNEESFIIKRPFRNPHHTASDISIVGGGKDIRLGEISLSHQGILFLDELGEFKTGVIQSLREPMEEKKITISRVNYHLTYPAEFLLICASNPCPCGYYGSEIKACICSEGKIQKYLSKLSGPFLDRIDIQLELNSYSEEKRKTVEVDLDKIQKQILVANEMQKERFQNFEFKYNGLVEGRYIDEIFSTSDKAKNLWDKLQYENEFSIRKILKIKKISRTIADLEGSSLVTESHIFEALEYQKRKYQSVRLVA